MASSNAALPPLSELSGAVEELRRQLAAANDAQLASEVGHHHQTVLSNIMLTGQESGQVAPPEELEKGSSGAANTTAFSPVSNFKNGTDHSTSTDAQTAPPPSALDQISAGSDVISHHNQAPFNGQILTPDIQLAQAVQPAAIPESQAEQFSSKAGEPETAIVDTNDDPVPVVPIEDQSTNEDAGFSFTVPPYSFVDVDAGDSLTLSATLADGSPLPAWLVFDPVTQTFSGTPLNDDVGALTIRVTATDTSGATATQDFQVTVINTNDGPVAAVDIADQSTNEDAGFSFTVAPGSFSDVDVGDTLTLSATLADGSPLPAWLSFDPASQTFSGTPLNDDVGSLAIRVTATDTAGATATQDFTVSVANVNDAPVASVTIADQSANEDAGFSFTVPATSFTDVDAGDQLTLSATLADGSALPAWLSFDAATQTFSGTPLNDDVGSLAIRVTATDTSGATATQDFTVTVANVNDVPVASAVIADQSTNEDAGFSFMVPPASFIDVDVGDSLSLSARLTDGSPLPAWLSFDPATQTFSGTPLNDDVGSLVIRVTATDTSGATATQDFTVTVNNTNDAPVITSSNAASFAENATGIIYTAAATDVDAGTTLAYTISGTDAALLDINATTGAITFKSAPNFEAPGDAGTNNVYDITIGASDGTVTTTKDVAISVTNVNEAPTVTSAAMASFAENGIGTVYTAAATDPDAGTTLTYSISGIDASLFNINATTGAVTFKSAPNYEAPTDGGGNNVYDIMVGASDGTFTATKDVAISVTNVNEAPTITSGAAVSFAERATGTVYTVAATDPDAGATLTYSLTGTDAARFNINSTTGVITFKSTPNYEAPTDVGANNVYDVTVRASDGTNITTKAVAITVTNVNEAPVITSAASTSFAENGTGTVYTVAATDVDAGTTLTYSLTGTDAAKFNIDATTGAVTFKSSPNYEVPTDSGANNVYNLTVRASDGALTTSKAVAITVTNVGNEVPVFTSAGTANFAENGAGTVYTAAAIPDAGQTLTYSISGADASLFNINATTGAVTFKSSPNYEAPADAGGNNVYDLNVTASDGTNSATKAVAISVTNVNEAPTITSAATASFAENAIGTVYTVAATDQDAGATLTYSLTGTDAARFNINSTTGAITFKSLPNYEAPTDSGANNVYDVTVRASDGVNTTSKAVAITVANVNEAPTVTSAATKSFAENATGTVYTATATDPDAGTTLTYSISGADAALFDINATTGAVTFKSSPNYEVRADAGANNVYDITVGASDGTNTTTKAVAITVTNVNEAPTITSGAAASFAENAGGTVHTAAATDQDAGATLTYSLTGADAARFNINSTTGAITFKSSPNYEAPTDAGANNVYDVTVRASDGVNIATKAVAITVTNVNEAPTVTSAATASFAENGAGTVYTAAATDPDAGTTLTYSLTGTDAALFNINATTGVVTFKSSPNYEAPTDAGANNVYNITVGASDGAITTSKAVAVTVTNVTNEAPAFTSAGTASFAENATGTVYTASAIPEAGRTLTYSLTGTDAALFNINATTGAVTFKSSPNYEAPTDAGGNNVYDVTVRASDGTNITTKAVAITVTNVNEAPTVTSAATASLAENSTGTVYTAAATDPDAGTTLTYSIAGADAALFDINATTGAVTFKSSPNYEAPTDAGGNNVYDVNVTASDGTNAVAKAVAITVTNVNEAPAFTSAATASFAENATGTVYAAAATDPEVGTALTYSISGADASLFDINATTGAVSFKSSPNYEAPTDTGANNVYDVTVSASDGSLTTSKAVAITVTNVNEAPTGITVTGPLAFQETAVSGGTIGTAYDPGTLQPVVATLAAVDPDAGDTLTYSLVGGPAGQFTISGNQITVAAGASFDYETTPSYALTVRATDSAGHTFDQAVSVNISNYAATYTGTAGNDTATGTSEEDTMSGGGGSDTLYGGDGNDTLTASTGGSTLDGGNGNDTIYGGNGNDIISGGVGNDTVYASGGIDTIDGGAGSDTIIYSIGSADMTIDLSKGLGYYTSYPAGADSFSNFENAAGGSANDTLIGNSLDNILSGGAGNDTFNGGTGNDTLIGGDGADLFFLQAGLGNDSVIGGAAGSWIDAIDLHDASGNSYSGAFPSDWTLILTSGSITSTGSETLTLSTDSSGYMQHTDGTQVNFTEIEQIRW